ncbi:hypothetical protein GCM10027040_21310 [Halomonas shantousis]
MNHRAFSIVALAIGLASVQPLALADESPALQRAREAAKQTDMSRFFTSRSDARSQSFMFGGTQEHPFSVEKAGRYVFESSTLPGDSNDYHIEATLLDDQGRIIATEEAQGQNGGLHLEQQLEPGDYRLRVKANKFGTASRQGNSYVIEVAGLDARGERLSSDESGIEEGGSGIMFGGPGRDGRTTAFVDHDDEVAAIAAPRRSADTAETSPDTATTATGAATTTAAAGASTAIVATPGNADRERAEQTEPQMPSAFDEIVADIKIRERGEVMSFDVVEPGTVSIASSTFPGNEGTYRLEARLLDEQGNVVASDKGEGFAGDFNIETRLQPGRYRVWVNGRKFGSAMSGVNNYTLRVQQLDTD